MFSSRKHKMPPPLTIFQIPPNLTLQYVYPLLYFGAGLKPRGVYDNHSRIILTTPSLAPVTPQRLFMWPKLHAPLGKNPQENYILAGIYQSTKILCVILFVFILSILISFTTIICCLCGILLCLKTACKT